MTVLIKILTAVGVLLLALLLPVLWFIIIPRKFRVEYSKQDGLIAQVKLAFFKITIYPLPKFIAHRKGKKEAKADKQPDEKKEKHNPLKDIQFSFDLVKQVLSAAKGIMKKVFAAIKFDDVSFTLPVYAGSPENTQKTYGMVTNSFYGLSMFLQKYLQITFKSPIFVADFADTYGDAVYFYTKITASPIMLLTAGYFAYTQYIRITENNKKTAAAGGATQVAEQELSNG